VYLATVLDLYSRRLLSAATRRHPDAELAGEAIKMAVAARGGHEQIARVTFHTDSEYVRTDVPGRPDPHSDGRSLSFLGYVGRAGAPGEAPRLAAGVT
jgi:transposase InsO family protein